MPKRICPYCQHFMEYIEPEHTELTPVAYEMGYWECFHCGCTLDNDYFRNYDEEF